MTYRNNFVPQRPHPYWGQRHRPAPEPEPMNKQSGPARAADRPENNVVPPENVASDWQEKAVRLQAEMDNFRKRQTRRADEAIAAERERLLTLFLPAIDNLERALSQPTGTDDAFRQGVELTRRELMRRLEQEGVTRMETVGQLLDPQQHEAIAAIPAEAESGTVVEELEAGYMVGDKLLRPAKVIVAK